MKFKLPSLFMVLLLLGCSDNKACKCYELTKESHISADFTHEMSKWNQCKEAFGEDWRNVVKEKCN